MTLERTAGICFCIVITSAIATGQQKSETTGDLKPVQRVQTRSESGGRHVVVETVDTLDIDGRPTSIEEVVTETTRPGPNSAQTSQDVFRLTVDRQRRLAETTESRQETQPNGNTGAVYNTWVPDLNGRLRLTSRVIEQTTSSAPDVRQTDTTLLLPNLNETLRETERTEHTARRINREVVRHESTHLVRDINGQWRPIEIRRGEVREVRPSERMEVETIERPDLNGKLAVIERNVISRANANEQDVVIEIYAPYTDALPGADGRPPLSERVRRTTTATADGGSYTVEEVEARSRVSPTEPMRVVRRTVTTVRPIGPDQWATERQVFERDANGRLRLVSN